MRVQQSVVVQRAWTRLLIKCRIGILRDHTPATSSSTDEAKIWSTPHSDMGRIVNYNGPKVGGPVRARALPLPGVILSSAAG